jgi:hypothetical protein
LEETETGEITKRANKKQRDVRRGNVTLAKKRREWRIEQGGDSLDLACELGNGINECEAKRVQERA